MLKVIEYENNAVACRQIATNTTNPTRKQQLLHMAETWDRLASERRVQLSEHPGHDGVKPSV